MLPVLLCPSFQVWPDDIMYWPWKFDDIVQSVGVKSVNVANHCSSVHLSVFGGAIFSFSTLPTSVYFASVRHFKWKAAQDESK